MLYLYRPCSILDTFCMSTLVRDIRHRGIEDRKENMIACLLYQEWYLDWTLVCLDKCIAQLMGLMFAYFHRMCHNWTCLCLVLGQQSTRCIKSLVYISWHQWWQSHQHKCTYCRLGVVLGFEDRSYRCKRPCPGINYHCISSQPIESSGGLDWRICLNMRLKAKGLPAFDYIYEFKIIIQNIKTF